MDAAECLDLPQEQTSASVALMSQNDPKQTFTLCKPRRPVAASHANSAAVVSNPERG